MRKPIFTEEDFTGTSLSERARKEKVGITPAEKVRRIAKRQRAKNEQGKRERLAQIKERDKRISTLRGFIAEIVDLVYNSLDAKFTQEGASITDFDKLQCKLEGFAEEYPNADYFLIRLSYALPGYVESQASLRFRLDDNKYIKTKEALLKGMEKKLAKFIAWCQDSGYKVKVEVFRQSSFSMLVEVKISWE